MQFIPHLERAGVRHRASLPRYITFAIVLTLQNVGHHAWAAAPVLSLAHAQQLAVAHSLELGAQDAAISAIAGETRAGR